MDIYIELEDMPTMLSAADVSKIFGIGLTNTYELMRSKGFPTLRLCKRMVVPKYKLIEWIEANTAE